MASSSSFPVNICYCDVHEHFEAAIISNCGQLHRLCAQCVYLAFFDAAESGDNQHLLCPICEQKIRHVGGFNKEAVTRAFLNMMNTTKNKRQAADLLHLPTELHAELMRFLDMKSLRKMMPISRLPYALFGEKVRKWNANRNKWAYQPPKDDREAREQKGIFEISQSGLRVCKGRAQSLANVLAKNPFKLENLADNTSTTGATFYFEIRVNKSTGPILFGLVKRDFNLGKCWQEERHRAAAGQPRSRRRKNCFLANDIGAWQHIPGEYAAQQHRCLEFFAQRNLIPAGAARRKFRDGDVLGCGLRMRFSPRQSHLVRAEVAAAPPLRFYQRLRHHHQLFFTRNGQLFGQPIRVSPANDEEEEEELFPFVGLVDEGTAVTGNFGDLEPYLYNIGQHKG